MGNPEITTVSKIKDLLFALLQKGLNPTQLEKLELVQQKLSNGFSERRFYFTFSVLSQKVGKGMLAAAPDIMNQLQALRSEFSTDGWTADRTARVWLILLLLEKTGSDFLHHFEKIFSTADGQEQVALYSCLPLLPHSLGPELEKRAAEGVRTNITAIFDAVALNNPYAADYLEEGAWNQLVLKAAFMDRPIYQISGLDRRANAVLAKIISDYAHERWAAGRIVSPEFWRPVTPFLNDELLEDIKKLFNDSVVIQKQAAALVCYHSDYPPAKELLQQHPTFNHSLADQTLNWHQLALAWWEQKDK